MAFNEPNFSSQANLGPAQAAALWLNVEAQLSAAGLLGRIRLGAPSASPAGDLMSPQLWLTQFFGNCTGCHFDFQCFHIYDCNYPYFGGCSEHDRCVASCELCALVLMKVFCGCR